MNKRVLVTDRVLRLLKPQADECGEGVVQHQEHDGVNKVVPLQMRVHFKHPGVGAVTQHHRGDAKQTERDKQTKKVYLVGADSLLLLSSVSDHRASLSLTVSLTYVKTPPLSLIHSYQNYTCYHATTPTLSVLPENGPIL